MDVSFFISARLRFKGRIAMMCIAVSYLVMIIAVAVASGYRYEVRNSLSSLSGDVMITSPGVNVLDAGRPIYSDPSYLDHLWEVDAVERIDPVVYRAGMVKHGDEIYGVIFKGLKEGVSSDSLNLCVSLPESLAERTGLGTGDQLLTYFVGDKVKMRRFNVVAVHESMVETDGRYVVYASIEDLQRLNGWNEGEVSALEIRLKNGLNDEDSIRRATEDIGYIINGYSSEDDASAIATSAISRFPQLFSWLDLIDFNVYIILILMTIVAGFNMISGLLIMLFEHIPTIGLLKALGMTDRAISKVFLSSSAVLVAKGMAVGNLIALTFCILQDMTHLLKLNPEMYYVSFVPVNLNFGMILFADLISFAVIMVLLLIPCLFISRVDPAQTVRVS